MVFFNLAGYDSSCRGFGDKSIASDSLKTDDKLEISKALWFFCTCFLGSKTGFFFSRLLRFCRPQQPRYQGALRTAPIFVAMSKKWECLLQSTQKSEFLDVILLYYHHYLFALSHGEGGGLGQVPLKKGVTVGNGLGVTEERRNLSKAFLPKEICLFWARIVTY